MADEVTDCSYKKDFVLSFRWIHKAFDYHDDFIGIYNVDNIQADTLVTVIKDVCVSKKFFRKSRSIFYTLFWACFKFGCCRYGKEYTVFERQYGNNIRNLKSYLEMFQKRCNAARNSK